MAVSVSQAVRSVVAPRAVRVMRWSFERKGNCLVCELGLDRDDSSYELSVAVPWGMEPATERFRDVHSAIDRQLALERVLLEEGWSLTRFETAETMR